MSDNTTDDGVVYPIPANTDLLDESGIEDFMQMLFSRVLWKPYHFVNLRGIGEKGTPREGKFHADEWIQPGLEEFPDEHMTELTIHHAKRWAQHHIAAFVVPAVMKAARGTSENVGLMVAVVLDLDTGDTNAKAAWIEQHIGTPTMVVASGGTTDAGTPKLHLYWVLDDPVEDVASIVEMRHVLAEKIGGDLQFGRGTPDNPLGRAHQPIRIGGSVHAKHGHAAAVRVLWTRGPTPDADELGWRIRQAPESPWAVRAVSAPSIGFEFGPTLNHRPDTDTLLTEDVYEGGEGDKTRFATLGRVIGGLIGTARRGAISLQEAQDQAYAWMQVHMRPPYSDQQFQQHWHRILERDTRQHGALPAATAQAEIEAPRALVATPELGLREWAAHRWTSGEPKPREFIVEGLVLARKPHLVVAEGGAGKTFSMLDLGLKVAAWEDGADLRWWGQPVRRGGTVVMLTTEDDADELHIRIHDIDPDGLRYKAGDRWIVAPLVNMGGAFTLGERDRAGQVAPAARWLQTLDLLRGLPNVALVIVDTLNTTLHGEENSATIVGEYAKLLQPVCGEIGAALVVTHHIRKTDPKNPVHTPDEMAAAVRGSSALPAAFRAVLGIWHCHDFSKRMQSMGMEPKPKQLWRMGVLKANNPEMVDGVRFLLRQGSGMLEDVTGKAVEAQRSTGAQQAAWLVLAVRLAAEAGYPYTTGSRNDNGGLYARRAELPEILRGLAFRNIDLLREQVIGTGDVVVTGSRGTKARRLLDVPGGVFAGSSRGEDVRPGAMTPVDWSEWEWSDVEGMPVPVGTPRLVFR